MTTRHRVVQVVRSLGALVLLIALVIGPPALLARAVGWPLPTRLPSVDQLRDALGGSTIEEGTIVKALALVCWIAWLQIATSAVIEAHAWVKGTMSAQIPFGGLVQPAVRQLVISAALIFAGLRSSQPSPIMAAKPAVVGFATPAPAMPSSAFELAQNASPVSPVAPRGTITVKPRDSLWRLAERHLGDGTRWRELWDLNQGRAFSNGRTFHDPNVIQPGWVLDCPPDAVDVDLAPATSPVTPPPDLPTATPAPDPITAPTPARTAAPSTTAAHTSSPATNARQEPSPASQQGSSPASRHGADPHVPFELVTGSLVAAGFVALLDRLRRVQLRRRRAGRVPRLVDEKAADTEVKLRLSAVDAKAERVDLALRALAGCLAQVGDRPLPAIDLVSVGVDAVEILLSAKTNAPTGPFEVSADGRAWTLPSSTSLDDTQRLAAGHAAPAPALVTVGALDDRQLLVDLERAPRLLVTGNQEIARQLIWSTAIEMSTSPWVDDMEVLLVTTRESSLSDLERTTIVPCIDEAIERVASAARDTERDLERAGASTTLACRVRHPADPWTPVVVLVPEVADDDDVRRLLDAVVPNGGVGVLAAAHDLDAEYVLQADESGATLLPLGLRMRLACLADEMVSDAESLLAYALAGDIDDEVIPEDDVGSLSASYVPRTAFTPEAGGVLVSVLGPVEVRGAERTIDRRRSLELVTYLALRPEGVDESRLRAVLWPESDPSRENFNQTVSRARQPLGHAVDGTLHFPRLFDDEGSLYRLGPTVTTDAALLEQAYRSAKREGSGEAMEHLASMLALIRGLPFEGTKGGWEWTFTEGHSARLAAMAAEAAHLVAQWSIECGEIERALWATAQGLRAAPGDEVLYRDRMRAHERAGNLAGVESVMKELRGIVEEGEPYDAIHPDTLAYYEQLTHRVRRTG